MQRRGDRELVFGRVEDVKVALAPVGVARRKLWLEPALERQRIHRVDVADVEDAAAPWLARCRVVIRRLRVQIDVERVQLPVWAAEGPSKKPQAPTGGARWLASDGTDAVNFSRCSAAKDDRTRARFARDST